MKITYYWLRFVLQIPIDIYRKKPQYKIYELCILTACSETDLSAWLFGYRIRVRQIKVKSQYATRVIALHVLCNVKRVYVNADKIVWNSQLDVKK